MELGMSIIPRIPLFFFTTFVILTADLRSEIPLDSLRSYLQEYCYSCHGPDEQQGEQRFDHLSNDLTDPLTMEAWQGILDQINLGAMPPNQARNQAVLTPPGLWND